MPSYAAVAHAAAQGWGPAAAAAAGQMAQQLHLGLGFAAHVPAWVAFCKLCSSLASSAQVYMMTRTCTARGVKDSSPVNPKQPGFYCQQHMSEGRRSSQKERRLPDPRGSGSSQRRWKVHLHLWS